MLSDNGSEYEGQFADLLRARGIARYYIYSKTPKMNAHAERFDRTVQEEFLDYHEDLLWRGDEANLAALNRKLAEVAALAQRGAPARGPRPTDPDRRLRPGVLDARPPPPAAAAPSRRTGDTPSAPPDRSGSVVNEKMPNPLGRTGG